MAKTQKEDVGKGGAKTCGIVMPITAWGDHDSQHWLDVKEIIGRAVRAANMEPRPVWESTDTDIIQGRIVRNLYENPMVVCDVSGLNPNVMFELGMRLTFRKPVVIVADDTTRLPFDTNVIETMSYPADLHFSKIEQFIVDVAGRIIDLSTSADEGRFQPYLDTFGAFTVVEPQANRVDFDQYVVQKLDQIGDVVNRLDRESVARQFEDVPINALTHFIPMSAGGGWPPERIHRLVDMWEQGKSASEIADALGGVSRNAVIGKAHRLGLRSPRVASSDNSESSGPE